jgi:hypothetical protein
LALRSNGFPVRVVTQFDPEEHAAARVVLSISEKGCPIDVMLYEDDAKGRPAASTLRIFLVDSLPDQELTRGFEESSMLFLNRKHLDMRFVLHTLDHFLEKVVVPRMETEEGEDTGGAP